MYHIITYYIESDYSRVSLHFKIKWTTSIELELSRQVKRILKGLRLHKALGFLNLVAELV
jgi:hypothetical protein